MILQDLIIGAKDMNIIGFICFAAFLIMGWVMPGLSIEIRLAFSVISSLFYIGTKINKT